MYTSTYRGKTIENPETPFEFLEYWQECGIENVEALARDERNAGCIFCGWDIILQVLRFLAESEREPDASDDIIYAWVLHATNLINRNMGGGKSYWS